MARFVIPAARQTRWLHVPEDGVFLEQLDDDDLPLTMCGLPMTGTWVYVPRQCGLALCHQCAHEAGLIRLVPPL